MTDQPHKPRKWIAAVLGLLSPPLGMLYAAHFEAALAYFSIALAFGVMGVLSSAWGVAAGYVALVLSVVGAVHAYRLANRYPDEKPRPGYSRWYGILGFIAGTAVLAIVLRTFFFEPFRAPSGSMLPTVPLRAGLIVQKWGYGNYGTFGQNLVHTAISAPLARGDLIVFEFPEDRAVSFVKRLVGLPGDKIVYRGKQLFINGEAVPQRPDGQFYEEGSRQYLTRVVETLPGHEHGVLIGQRPGYLPSSVKFPFADKCTYTADEVACEVPAGHYFTLGDNRDNSNDSRMWGFLPADHIVGKVVFVGS